MMCPLLLFLLAVYRNELCDMKEKVAQQLVYAKANGLDMEQITTEKMIEQQLRTKQVLVLESLTIEMHKQQHNIMIYFRIRSDHR